MILILLLERLVLVGYLVDGGDGLLFDRGWWGWSFTGSTTGRRAEGGVSP
jgi:hypothetical protein